MKGRLISNTGPIIALCSIDRLEILRGIFEEAVLPETVRDEIMQGSKNFIGLGCYSKAMWIKVQSLANPIEPLLCTLLDKGEDLAEAVPLNNRSDFTG
jgi:predicted nucleic acid-binding protein